MKNKIISTLLTMLIVLSLLPVSVFAATTSAVIVLDEANETQTLSVSELFNSLQDAEGNAVTVNSEGDDLWITYKDDEGNLLYSDHYFISENSEVDLSEVFYTGFVFELNIGNGDEFSKDNERYIVVVCVADEAELDALENNESISITIHPNIASSVGSSVITIRTKTISDTDDKHLIDTGKKEEEKKPEEEKKEEKPVQYTVKFNSNGGTVAKSKTVNSGAKITLPETVKRDHSFDGWYTDTALTQKFNANNGITKNMTLHAKWTRTSCTVWFETNASAMAVEEKVVNVGGKLAELPEPTRYGYTFDGWYKDEVFTQLFDINQPINETITLYAKWVYKIWFETNGGAAIDPILVYPDQVTAALPVPQKRDNNFAGWYTDEALTQAFDITKPITGNMTVYAKWSQTQCTVWFETNGGNDIHGEVLEVGGKLAQLPVPVKEGYSFEGWYANTELTQAFDINQAINTTVTLYAKWEKNHDVWVESNGGTWVNDYNKLTVKNGEKLSEVPVVTKYGYFFKGWYTDEALTVPFDADSVITSNITIYAKWEEEKKDEGPADVSGFKDISKNDWFYNDIDWAYTNGFMKGKSKDKFNPHDDITSSMTLEVLAKLSELDVSELSALGIDESDISRENIAVAVVAYFEHIGVEYDADSATVIFADENLVSVDAKEALKKLFKLEIFKGKGNNIIDPTSNTTRAEFAALMHRVADFIEK